MANFRIKIERDVSTDHWLVVEHTRRGWSVLHRCETQELAHRLASTAVNADRDLAYEAE